MGDIADAMLDGTLCEGCGAYIESGEAEGFPRYCSDQCARDRGVEPEREDNRLPRFNRYSIPPRAGTVECEFCPAWVKPGQGMRDHIRAKHPEKSKEK